MPAQAFLRRLLARKIRVPARSLCLAVLSITGLAGTCFCLGAGVMYFQLPSSQFMRDAFTGARAMSQRGLSEEIDADAPTYPAVNRVDVDIAERAQEGFTLYTTTSGAWAALIDMKGKIVHRWHMPFSQIHASMTEVADPLPDPQIHWFGSWLFPNGDLLAVYHADGDTPYGCGLVKLDRDSNVLWTYAGRVHHDVDVGADGKIYCIKHCFARKSPEGMAFIQTPYLADDLVVLSPEGKELQRVALLEAFRDSKYAATLAMNIADESTRGVRGDYLHPNRVMVLDEGLADKFPLFQAGQVLLSLRNIDTVAVLDIARRTIVWAAQGPWRGQHAAAFLPNGHVLLYDNFGAHSKTRVLEYDPVTQAVPWSFAKERFLATHRGTTQRLANGNTLIVHPNKCRIFEVTADQKIVWDAFCREPAVKDSIHVRAGAVTNINCAGVTDPIKSAFFQERSVHDLNSPRCVKLFAALALLLLWAGDASAYVGPGAGLDLVSGFTMPMLGFVLASVSAMVLWPVYALMRFFRGMVSAGKQENAG